jgi:hypothetical protein
VRVWDLENGNNGADWPMFKRDAQRQSRIPRKTYVDAAPERLILFHSEGIPGLVEGAIRIQNPKGGAFNWSATAPSNISISPTSGTLRAGQAATVHVTVTASGLVEGLYELGNVDFVANMIGEESDPAYDSVRVSLYVGTPYRNFAGILFR